MNYTESPSHRAARAIRARLADRRESIEFLSESTGIALSTLKRRMQGLTPFSIDELALIAMHFDTTVSQVITPVSEVAA